MQERVEVVLARVLNPVNGRRIASMDGEMEHLCTRVKKTNPKTVFKISQINQIRF